MYKIADCWVPPQIYLIGISTIMAWGFFSFFFQKESLGDHGDELVGIVRPC